MNSGEPLDAAPPQPLTPAEAAHFRALASSGITPSFDIVRRFVATIRKTFSADKGKTEKTKKATRNAKPKPDENQVDFF